MSDRSRPHSPRRVTLVASSPKNEILDFFFPNYGVRRIEAAVRADPALEHVELSVVEELEQDEERALAAILATEPQVVAFSSYVWSMALHHRLARRLRVERPGCALILGGPCAHPSVLALPPYRDGSEVFDALVLGEGEAAFRRLLSRLGADPDDDASWTHGLRDVPGLALPRRRGPSRAGARAQSSRVPLPRSGADPAGWLATAGRYPIARRDALASPYQSGAMPRGGIAYLQRYYGCPLSCTYCEWGFADDAKNVCSREVLVRELEAFAELECTGAMVVDAGLNMNARAFENLRDAERDVGFLRDKPFFTEVYPSQIGPDTLDFLAGIGRAHAGVGLQSYDPDVLARMDRAFDPDRFEQVVRDLASVCSVTVEVIVGLPGDDPSSFRRTIDRLRRLPAGIRVYHCVALPTGFLTRAPASFDVRFDPHTLKVRSCLGWPEGELQHTLEWLDDRASDEGGIAFEYWWGLPGPEHRSGGDPVWSEPTSAASGRGRAADAGRRSEA